MVMRWIREAVKQSIGRLLTPAVRRGWLDYVEIDSSGGEVMVPIGPIRCAPVTNPLELFGDPWPAYIEALDAHREALDGHRQMLAQTLSEILSVEQEVRMLQGLEERKLDA